MVENKKRSYKLPKSVRVEEFKVLINEVPKKDINFRIACLLSYGSGLRISEVLRVQPNNFQANGSLFISESKYGVERYVPIPKGWKEEFNRALPLKISVRTLQRKFKAYCKKAKISEAYTFHSLRHGFATRCLESGMPINQVQLLLGHSNVSTTSVYIKASPVDAIKNYEDLF